MLRLLVACTLLALAHGHGRLWWPASRAAMWRHGFDNPANYNDNEQFCGGFGYQQSQGGKCGVCGDAWDGPLQHVPGPDNIYANGIIVDTYDVNDVMDIQIWITANHYGWFEFRLCPVNDKNVAATQECLDQNLLELADGSGTRYTLQESAIKIYDIQVKLPQGLTCSQCVLQWKYNTANSWGTDPDTGASCVGCGPQEQFYGCADIAIDDGPDGPEPELTAASTGAPQTQPTDEPVPTPSEWPTDIPNKNCRAIGIWEGDAGWDAWCEDNCTHFPPNCPQDICFCEA